MIRWFRSDWLSRVVPAEVGVTAAGKSVAIIPKKRWFAGNPEKRMT